MVNRFETHCVAYYAYFSAKLYQFLKTFENLVFVIMSTREIYALSLELLYQIAVA